MTKRIKFNLKIASCLLLAFCTNSCIKAQADTSRFATYRASPVWKDMLDDTAANYFEVQKAFELFWKGKEMPEEENEIIGERQELKNNFINKTFNAKALKEQKVRESLAFDCKKYRWWLISVSPYVQEDGSILFPQQRLELWKKHYEELKRQSTK
jgi:hypothetical protein